VNNESKVPENIIKLVKITGIIFIFYGLFSLLQSVALSLLLWKNADFLENFIQIGISSFLSFLTAVMGYRIWKNIKENNFEETKKILKGFTIFMGIFLIVGLILNIVGIVFILITILLAITYFQLRKY
jgi:hypothetical protein